ncbi:hypothetical protein X777_12526 [Ooceraea biroi]|uniref:Uncharacterized protein n=1 Tax=Ooceraea biroi TaxID=2015173 RepID=A0A026VZB4_OOCBI|nr:hypothetical protein X777_12526 [Ooceraea biroi]
MRSAFVIPVGDSVASRSFFSDESSIIGKYDKRAATSTKRLGAVKNRTELTLQIRTDLAIDGPGEPPFRKKSKNRRKREATSKRILLHVTTAVEEKRERRSSEKGEEPQNARGPYQIIFSEIVKSHFRDAIRVGRQTRRDECAGVYAWLQYMSRMCEWKGERERERERQGGRTVGYGKASRRREGERETEKGGGRKRDDGRDRDRARLCPVVLPPTCTRRFLLPHLVSTAVIRKLGGRQL